MECISEAKSYKQASPKPSHNRFNPETIVFFFQNVILFSYVVPFDCNFCLKLVHYEEYIISTVYTDGLVL